MVILVAGAELPDAVAAPEAAAAPLPLGRAGPLPAGGAEPTEGAAAGVPLHAASSIASARPSVVRMTSSVLCRHSGPFSRKLQESGGGPWPAPGQHAASLVLSGKFSAWMVVPA